MACWHLRRTCSLLQLKQLNRAGFISTTIGKRLHVVQHVSQAGAELADESTSGSLLAVFLSRDVGTVLLQLDGERSSSAWPMACT